MGIHSTLLAAIGSLLLILDGSLQNLHEDVDLVTRLSNNWIPTLLSEVSKENENVVASPYGLMSNLAMIMEATQDQTREEFLRTLNLTAGNLESLRKGFKAYCELFQKHSSAAEAAGSFNSVALKASFKMNSSYKDLLEKYYCAEVGESSGGKEATMELTSTTGVMSHWKDYEKLAVYTFLSHRPTIPFRRRNNSTVMVPMIPQVGNLKSGRWENSQVILIPLQAKLVDFLIIVPDDVRKMDSAMKKLGELTIPKLVESLGRREMEVFVPQTAIVNRNFNLTSVLIRTGIQKVFNGDKANLKAASNGPVHLVKMDQNSFFATSFVAVNSVSGISSASGNVRRKREVKSFYADRPFLFFVLQKDTKLALLSGKVENPVQIPV